MQYAHFMCQAHHGRSSDLGPLCLHPHNCYLTLAASPAGFATLIPPSDGQGTPISKGAWTSFLPPAGSLPSRIGGPERRVPHASVVRNRGRWHDIRKKEGGAETAPSGFPLLNNCLDFVVKTVTRPSSGQTQRCLTSVISGELVCQRG